MNTELLTLKDVCGLLKIKESHLRSLIFKKEIIPIRIGRLIRFNKSELAKWLERLSTIGGSHE